MFYGKKDMFYKITLTTSGGLSKDNLDALKTYFSSCPHVFLSVEYGSVGSNCHVEGVVEYETTKTSNVTNRIKLLYKKMDLEWTSHSVKVKQVTHLVGAIIYASKELKELGESLLLKGWTSSWIDQQVKDNVKAIPYKQLLKKWTRVTQNSGGPLMYEWASANNMSVTCKQDYIEVKKLMARQGFLFGSCKDVGLFEDVCSCFGDGEAAAAVAEAALHWL